MKTRTAEPETLGKDVTKQPHRFLGLYLAPLPALPFAWLIHLWAFGLTLGQIDFHPDPALPTLTLVAVGAAIVGLALYAYDISAHRDQPVRWAFTGTVAVVGLLFGANIGTGPHYVVSGAFWIVSWGAATLWVLPRLNVARKDSRAEDSEDKDGFWKRLGVSVRTKFRTKVVHDDDGNPIRLEADVQHAPGETVTVFHEGGVASMESAAAAPPGLASAVADDNRADRSRIVIPLDDPFKRVVPVGPLSAPGRSIADWTTVADYADGQIGRFALAGGIHTPTPTSYALIGTTRSGKSGTETQAITEWGSRCDWVCLYLNQAKGLQDIRPILPVIEAAVIAEDGDAGLAEYGVALKQARAIMIYRQQQLARFAVSAWSPRCADPDPVRRPSRLGSRGREVMDRMPFLTIHLAEADALFASSRFGDDAIYVASKGLSLGVNVGLSLQKPDWKSMPTNLRSQIGLWFVHGLAEEGDEEFVLDVSVRRAGANPGKWGQRRPGQHYMIGAGVPDESRFPMALKTRFIIGSDRDSSGRKYSFDELNDRYSAEMLRRNSESARTMAKLDRGSAEATGGWWDDLVVRTDALRVRMLSPQSAADDSAPVRIPQSAPHRAESAPPPAFRGRPVPQSAEDAEEEVSADEMDEMHEEAAEVTQVEGIDIYPDPTVAGVDLTAPFDPLPVFDDPADDPLYDPEEEAKPAPKDRPAALDALAQALDELLADPALRDPKDPSGRTVIIGPGMVADRYRFKSRPWFSAELAALAEARGPLAARFSLELAEDLGIREGKYRLSRVGNTP